MHDKRTGAIFCSIQCKSKDYAQRNGQAKLESQRRWRAKVKAQRLLEKQRMAENEGQVIPAERSHIPD